VTIDAGGRAGDTRELIATELDRARRRSLDLLAPVPEPDLVAQHSPLMSPLVWDLAHVGNYEDQWLLGALAAPRVGAELDDIYDAFRHPRRDRPSLPFLEPDRARHYINDVRSRAVDVLDTIPVDDGPALVRDGFVYGMVVQHEHQHIETMLATLQLRQAPYAPPDALMLASAAAPPPGGAPETLPREVLVPAGPFVMGTDLDPWAYDNERPASVVDVPAFWIDTTPVTNDDYLAFIDDGGYDRADLWTPTGWAWRREAGLRAPQFWERGAGGSWTRTRFGATEDLPGAEPVQHVCWYEADAFARWAGKRLPTEAEWEKAASWTPDGRKRRYPWGDTPPTPALANLDFGPPTFGPTAVGGSPLGASPWGCRQMVGDVWEWTSSDFLPFPGFRTFPYREYSEVFFGPEYKVLRGGSWATHPTAVRTTFRNWDYPIRRQIFAGFRCARGT
jgi:iron(II)-dependent oxidoreductase